MLIGILEADWEMRCVLQPDPGFPTLTTWQIDLEIAIFHKFDGCCHTRLFGKTLLKLITLVLSKRRRGLLFLEFIFIQRGRPLIKKVRSDSTTINNMYQFCTSKILVHKWNPWCCQLSKSAFFSKNLDRGLKILTTYPLLENGQCKADLLPLEAENGQLWGAKTDLL